MIRKMNCDTKEIEKLSYGLSWVSKTAVYPQLILVFWYFSPRIQFVCTLVVTRYDQHDFSVGTRWGVRLARGSLRFIKGTLHAEHNRPPSSLLIHSPVRLLLLLRRSYVGEQSIFVCQYAWHPCRKSCSSKMHCRALSSQAGWRD